MQPPSTKQNRNEGGPVTELTIASAVLIGFLGSSHCLGMCGGLTIALGLGNEGENRWYLLSYNTGRVFMYGVTGALVGLFGEQIVSAAPAIGFLLHMIAGGLLVAMGLYISQWWMGLTKLEKIGGLLWKKIQPFSKVLIPVRGHKQALLLGVVWGLIPCGLVYSTLALALVAADWQQSALFMLAFGIGTLPAMLSVGFVGQNMLARLREKQFRTFSGLVIIVMSILTILVPLQHFSGSEQQHQHHSRQLDDRKMDDMKLDGTKYNEIDKIFFT